MPKNMSFSLTTERVRNRTKTVTRRKGWWKDKNGRRLLKPGDIVNACVKCMGLKPGEKVQRICQIRIVDVRRERLHPPLEWAVLLEPRREGFPELSWTEFVEMFCKHMGGKPDQEVTRIQFEYIDEDRS